ncbi:hypothetical protein N7530_010713 [Penicillium desertorum]|uniref:Uncharacterized protein n=1 Tax=Penicillium desertorum TaxID=1303715 RepID=A0A9W9WFZ0_9EURO|nr:hypothetical protein N7530_010713 [Penicillium desertorum]
MVAALCRSSVPGGFTRRSGVIRDPATPDPPHDLLPAQCLGSPRGPLGARPGCYGGALAELLPGASAVVTEARGPFGARHRWSLWIDGRWPYPETRIPGGSRPVGSAVRRRCPRGLDPSCEGHMPQPASAFTGAWSDPLRADWCWRSLVGGNWMVSASPRYAGGAAVTGRLVRPFHLTTFYPLGGRAPGLKPRVALP